MAFSLVLVGAFTPEDYGAIRYAIALAMIVSVGTQPFGQHVLARFVGKYKNDTDQLRRVVTNAWIILVALIGLTLLVAVPVLFMLGKFNVGILVIFMGVTLFYTYWGLSRGFLAPHKLTAAYVGSNVVQIALVFLLIYVLEIRSPLVALLIYGLSYLLPLALLQLFWPFPVTLELSLIKRDMIGDIVRFSRPIWVSHAGYKVYSSIDVLLLEYYSGTAAVGVYAVAKTLAIVFLLVPAGIATLLMPKAAALPGQAHRQLLKTMLALSMLTDGAILIVYLLLGQWFVRGLFGPQYVVEMSTTVILAFGMIALGAHSVITAILVGDGRAGVETISRIIAVVAAASAGWLLIPIYGPPGAATAMLVGTLAALITYGVMASTKMKTTNEENG